MFTLISEKIEQYCEEHTSKESEILYQLNRETHLKILRPRMLSGHIQGAFLSFISKMIKPQFVLEIGTYTGYSALCLAEGLIPNGELHTIEIDEELEEIIVKYFSKSSKKEQLYLHIGDANHYIQELKREWDLVFMDAEKKEYISYFEKILPNLKKGGIILVDNVLWSGKVVESVASNDTDTQAIIEFNKYIQADQRVVNTILPFRDGIMIIEKL
ncbi:MAG: methyltransferase [Bacteroidetes bacterium HGW-Bacteroidetes-20]|nr:MAG: methyltransferase [Bacteroidetes bacterium HGW-Bacteroidetes-20]